MSDAVILAIVSVVGAAVTATPAIVIGWRNSRKTEVVATKTDVVVEKLNEVHVLTNSNLAKVTEALNVANTKIEGLERLVVASTKAAKKTPL